MSWTLCTSGAAAFKAGKNANSDIILSGAAMEAWSDQAEGRICAECHTDFVTNFTTFDTQIQNALQDVCSSMIGMSIVSYDPNSYVTSREAETILDYNDDRVNKGLVLLKEKIKQKLST